MCVFWMFLWACLPNNCFGVFCQPQYSICVDFNSILFADFESDFSTYSYIGWNKSNGKIFKSNTLKFKIRVILFSSWNHVYIKSHIHILRRKIWWKLWTVIKMKDLISMRCFKKLGHIYLLIAQILLLPFLSSISLHISIAM